MDKKEKRPTLFEDQIDEIFLKGFKKSNRPATRQLLAADHFFILSSSKKPTYYRYFFELRDHFVFCRKERNGPEIAYMNVLNSFLKVTSSSALGEQLHRGLKFIKKKTYEELFSPDEAVVREWFERLKKFCVLTKFRDYYETKRVIGKGNYAKVFLVERKADQQEFAVKVYSKKAVMQDYAEKLSLIYEVKMLRLMDHPRVVRFHEIYEGESFIYCLCELYKGTDLLNAIIKKGFQPESKALTIAFQILEAVFYMHSLGVMHRDLKPENIIFKDSKQGIDIVVVDLGFASHLDDYQELFVRCGTPGYVAPEILKDKPYGLKVDVYSVGIILYIMWAKQPDRAHPLRRQGLRRHRREEHPQPHQLRLREVRREGERREWGE